MQSNLSKQLQGTVSNSFGGAAKFVTNLELTTTSSFAGLLLLNAGAGVCSEWTLVFFGLVFVVLVLVILVVSVVVFLDDSLDLGLGTLDQDWMTANVLALHLFCGLEELVCVGQADETEAFALRGTLVANDPSLLDRGVFGESFEQRFISHLTCKVTNEQTWVLAPFEKRRVFPLLTTSFTKNGLLLSRCIDRRHRSGRDSGCGRLSSVGTERNGVRISCGGTFVGCL